MALTQETINRLWSEMLERVHIFQSLKDIEVNYCKLRFRYLGGYKMPQIIDWEKFDEYMKEMNYVPGDIELIKENLNKSIIIFEKPAPADNWADRSARMKCGTCMTWVEKHPGVDGIIPDDKRVGRCRRCAPKLEGWPVTFYTDWCGEYKLDERALVGR